MGKWGCLKNNFIVFNLVFVKPKLLSYYSGRESSKPKPKMPTSTLKRLRSSPECCKTLGKHSIILSKQQNMPNPKMEMQETIEQKKAWRRRLTNGTNPV